MAKMWSEIRPLLDGIVDQNVSIMCVHYEI